MSLEVKQIQKLATLSRLEFSAERLPQFAQEFEGILQFVGKIQELNTEGVAPLTTTANIETSPERVDEVTAKNEREALQAGAPAAEMGFFVVPKIVE